MIPWDWYQIQGAEDLAREAAEDEDERERYEGPERTDAEADLALALAASALTFDEAMARVRALLMGEVT